MIEKLISLVLQFWAWITPIVILDQERLGFIRRFGKHHKLMTPGVNWKCPIRDVAETECGRQYPYQLDPQSLRTADGIDLVIQLGLTLQVVDIKPYWQEVYDGRANLQDVAAIELSRAVRAAKAEDVFNGKALQQVSRRVRAAAKSWGMQASDVDFVSCTRARSLRLWQTQTTAQGQE